MIDYYTTLILSFLGIAIGWFLARIAWEEVDQYRKILVALRGVCLLAAFALLLAFTKDVFLISILLIIYVFLHLTDRNSWAYSSLPILLWLSYGNDIFPYIASLLFLYGFPEGSLLARDMKNGKKVDALLLILKSNYWYLVVGVILGLIL